MWVSRFFLFIFLKKGYNKQFVCMYIHAKTVHSLCYQFTRPPSLFERFRTVMYQQAIYNRGARGLSKLTFFFAWNLLK